MNLEGARRRLRSPKVLIRLGVVIVLVAALGIVAAVSRPAGIRTRSEFVAGVAEAGEPVRLDTTLYLPETTPAPAVLLAHGLGGTKRDLDGQARSLAQHGFVVLAYTARGFGASGGKVHLDDPDYEIKDASLLIDHLAALPEVQRRDGDPLVAAAGASYGGAVALMLAGTDKRIAAVAADITWNDLRTALFPNALTSERADNNPGVYKKLWAGQLFATGSGSVTDARGCGNFAADVCAAYQQAAQDGVPDATTLALLHSHSPASVLGKITAPTLLSQGQHDSLFTLAEADANARGIAANGTPVRVIWRAGGHDSGSLASTSRGADVTAEVIGWFGEAFGSPGPTGTQPFDIDGRSRVNSEGQARVSEVLHVEAYPGIDAEAGHTREIAVAAPEQRITAPAGGSPAAVSSVPGLGSLLGSSGSLQGLSSRADGDVLAAAAGAFGAVPGQIAAFVSKPVDEAMQIAGSSTIRLTVTAQSTTDAVLFLALRVLSTGGDVGSLPGNLVAPLRLTGLRPGTPRTVEVALPCVSQAVAPGDRLAVTVATTDLGYELPKDARAYRVAVEGPLSVPTVDARVLRTGSPVPWLVTGLVIAALALAGVWFSLRRRRVQRRVEPALAAVPVVIDGLVKSYKDGYRAVDGVSLQVEAGQVLGLLGPNGAGKTTTLRMLVGLITPSAGTIRVFGEPVVPGAPVLARLGAFIEGPGFLPHLSGRQNLQLYWAATGRPDDEADLETALEIAGLGSSLDRRVKTYSHGMKQRLGIAQAMLGLPDVLVLDEPTNGLDPPQIAEMREVLRSYAASGRTVVVSSHLLAEVEQTCTHVAVMHKGRLVAAGAVAEIAGHGGRQLAVDDPERAIAVLEAAGIPVTSVPARRALEDVFLDLVGES